MSRRSRATPRNRAMARFARVSLQPRSVVAANVIGKIMAHSLEGFLRLFAGAIKRMTDAAHDRVIPAVLLVFNVSLTVSFHYRIHGRSGKHSFAACDCSLICADLNRAYRAAILILQSNNPSRIAAFVGAQGITD